VTYRPLSISNRSCLIIFLSLAVARSSGSNAALKRRSSTLTSSSFVITLRNSVFVTAMEYATHMLSDQLVKESGILQNLTHAPTQKGSVRKRDWSHDIGGFKSHRPHHKFPVHYPYPLQTVRLGIASISSIFILLPGSSPTASLNLDAVITIAESAP
jgi:hypothetical protein